LHKNHHFNTQKLEYSKLKSGTLPGPSNQGAYSYKHSGGNKELPELDRKVIDNLPIGTNLNVVVNSDEEYTKTVYDHGIRRRVGNNTSHSPLLRKSQMKQYSQPDQMEGYQRYLPDEDEDIAGEKFVAEKRTKGKLNKTKYM
jgi:hypothetical protein